MTQKPLRDAAFSDFAPIFLVRHSKIGRPSFCPSIAMRRQVEAARFAGASVEAIARTLGVSPATLRKHCSDELETGQAKRRAEILGMLDGAAREGNVSAAIHLYRLMTSHRRP